MIKFNLQNRKIIYILTGLIILPLFLVISFSSLINLYEKRSKILFKLGYDGHNNPLPKFQSRTISSKEYFDPVQQN